MNERLGGLEVFGLLALWLVDKFTYHYQGAMATAQWQRRTLSDNEKAHTWFHLCPTQKRKFENTILL